MDRYKHWSEVYPHSIFASVLLLDGKIESWKVVDYPKQTPGEFKSYWKLERFKDYTCESKEFICNNDEEHNLAFMKWAPNWFKQWPLADDYRGMEPYEAEEEQR